MVHSQLLALIRHAGASDGDADADLLGRFVGAADQPAFAELVRRYARLVWGQCRNLLANEADADDAFQATFLALAKSAKSLRATDRLGPWLHRVTHRVCLNARRAAARRARRERAVAAGERTAAPVPDSAWESAAAAVHEEVSRLPETLRVAFVLCHLEGKAPTDAARQLGVPWGTFSARLCRSRQRLLERLAARGLPAAVALAAVATPAASAALVARAITLGSHGASVPASVLSLITGVTVMGISRARVVAVLAAVVAIAVGGPGLFGARDGGPGLPAARAAPVPKESPVVKGKKLEELWVMLAESEANSSRALLEMSARPKAEVVAFLAGKLKPLTLTEERATKLVADLDDEKDEVAVAAYVELSYFDPRLALDIGPLMAAAKSGRQKQRLAALLLNRPAADLDHYAWCEIKHQLFPRGLGAKGVEQHALDMRNDPNKPAAIRTALDRDGHQGNVFVMLPHKPAQIQPKAWARATRAVMMLEHLATPEAVKALEGMAGGHADAAPTVAATEALDRLKKK